MLQLSLLCAMFHYSRTVTRWHTVVFNRYFFLFLYIAFLVMGREPATEINWLIDWLIDTNWVPCSFCRSIRPLVTTVNSEKKTRLTRSSCRLGGEWGRPKNRVLDGNAPWRYLSNTVERLCTAVKGVCHEGRTAMQPVPKLLWAIFFFHFCPRVRPLMYRLLTNITVFIFPPTLFSCRLICMITLTVELERAAFYHLINTNHKIRGHVAYTLQWATPFPKQKLSLPVREVCIHRSFGPDESPPQTVSPSKSNLPFFKIHCGYQWIDGQTNRRKFERGTRSVPTGRLR